MNPYCIVVSLPILPHAHEANKFVSGAVLLGFRIDPLQVEEIMSALTEESKHVVGIVNFADFCHKQAQQRMKEGALTEVQGR